MMQKILLTLIVSFLYSCASIKSFQIETKPAGAEVYIYKDKQKKYELLGKTPLKLTAKKMEEIQNLGKDFLALRIEKSGHVIEHLIYDLKTRKKVSYLLELKKIELWVDKEKNISSQLANDIARKVQLINRDILKRDLNNALKRTNSLIEIYPKANVFYDLKGSIYLLKGEKAKALVSLKKSININPDNYETNQILKVLEKRRGQK